MDSFKIREHISGTKPKHFFLEIQIHFKQPSSMDV